MREQWIVICVATASPRSPSRSDCAAGMSCGGHRRWCWPSATSRGDAHLPDDRRNGFERDLFLVAGGAAVENLLVSLRPPVWVRHGSRAPCSALRWSEVLDLPDGWQPLGAVAIGWPGSAPRRPAAGRSQRPLVRPLVVEPAVRDGLIGGRDADVDLRLEVVLVEEEVAEQLHVPGAVAQRAQGTTQRVGHRVERCSADCQSSH